MSTARGSAVYEAELIDKVSQPAHNIVAALGKLEAAFKQINPAAANLAQNMNIIGLAMKGMQQSVNNTGGTKLAQTFNRVSEMSSQLGTAVGRSMQLVGQGMRDAGIAGVAAAGLITTALYSAIKAASNATETFNAFKQVFGGAGPAFEDAAKWSEQFAASLGRSNTKTQQSLLTFQALFKGLGATTDIASGLSKDMTKLTVDFASFFNISDDESLQRMIAALSGSSEVLDKFGVNIREAALEAKGLELGLGGNIRKMGEYTKTLLRASIILGVMRDDLSAVGDAARTKMDWANQIKTLSAAFDELKVSIGRLAIKELLPTLQAVSSAISQLSISAANITAEQFNKFVNSLIALGGISASLVALGTAMMGLGAATTIGAIAVAGLLTTIGAIAAGGPIAVAISAVLALSIAIGSIGAGIIASMLPVEQFFSEMKDAYTNLTNTIQEGRDVISSAISIGDWSSAWEAFKATAEIAFLQIATMFLNIMGDAIYAIGLMMIDLPKKAVMGGAAGAGKAIGDAISAAMAAVDVDARMLDAQARLDKIRRGVADDVANQQGPQANADQLLKGQQWAIDQETKRNAVIEEADLKFKEGADAYEKNVDRIRKATEAMNKSMRTPQEVFEDALKAIDELATSNVGISNETAKRAQAEAAQEFIDATKKNSPKFQAASIGGFSSEFARNVSNFAPAFDPLLDETKKQTKVMEQIQKNTAKLGIAVF
jgi:hypothetical protein